MAGMGPKLVELSTGLYGYRDLKEEQVPVPSVDRLGDIAVASEEPKMNPKYIQAQKDGKVPMEFIPWNVLEDVAWVLKSGAEKYGTRNWRIDPILASTYEAAIARHALLEWASGQDLDKDSGRHVLAHVIACCMVVLDAINNGTLIDDRDRKESKGGGNGGS